MKWCVLNEMVLVLNEMVLVLNEMVLVLNEMVLVLNEMVLVLVLVIEAPKDRLRARAPSFGLSTSTKSMSFIA